MDPLTGLALSVVVVATFLYALYWVIRKGVAAGIRDSRDEHADEVEAKGMTGA